jgi:RNA polymerase sigma-70 factor (ECF subfamily)
MTSIDPGRLGELIDRHGPALALFARQWTHDAEDVVQEALVRLAGERPSPDRPVAWLYRVVRNAAISAARSAGRRKRREHGIASVRPWFAPTEDRALDAEAVTSALAALPVDQREVIVAHLWGELTFDEIAELIGTSKSAAHRSYQAGLAALRERLTSDATRSTFQ